MPCDLERKYNELLIKFQQLDHDKFWNDVVPKSKIELILEKYKDKEEEWHNVVDFYNEIKGLLK